MGPGAGVGELPPFVPAAIDSVTVALFAPVVTRLFGLVQAGSVEAKFAACLNNEGSLIGAALITEV